MTETEQKLEVLKSEEIDQFTKDKISDDSNDESDESFKNEKKNRKKKKREFRRLWTIRINAACRIHGISYSKFMDGMKKIGCAVNRKILSDLAISDPIVFELTSQRSIAFCRCLQFTLVFIFIDHSLVQNDKRTTIILQ